MNGSVRPGAVPGPRPAPDRGARGASLAEVAVAVFLLGATAAWAAPIAVAQLRRAALGAAARDLAGQIRRVRQEAAARTRYQALRFLRAGERWTLVTVLDGNRNGVRAADIESGVDAPSGPRIDLGERWGSVRPGLPAAPLPRLPPARGLLTPGADPIQLSGTDMISCGPQGSCTGGTIYLTSGGAEAAAVVVYAATGRVRLWRYSAEGGWIRF